MRYIKFGSYSQAYNPIIVSMRIRFYSSKIQQTAYEYRIKKYNCISVVYNMLFLKNNMRNPSTQTALWGLLKYIFDSHFSNDDKSLMEEIKKNLIVNYESPTEHKKEMETQYIEAFSLKDSVNKDLYSFFYSKKVTTREQIKETEKIELKSPFL